MIEADAPPVADRLEGIPTPNECKRVIGHDAAFRTMVDQYRAGRLHHAWLLSGPRGVGKASFALGFAKYLLSHPSPASAPHDWSEVHPSVQGQVSAGAHPELLHLTRPWDEKGKRFKTQLSVEEIRKTQAFYGMTAGAGGWRITIVDSADEMNASAANALLKILEEPPKRSLFFVLTHSPGGLLPTIRSRCQNLRLHSLSMENLETIIAGFETDFDATTRQQACALANGSVRRAIQLCQSGVLELYFEFESLMGQGGSGSPQDWVAAHKAADMLSRRGKEEAFGLYCDLVLGWVERQIHHHADRGPQALAGLSQVWDNATRSVTLANAFNLDKKQVILSLMGDLFDLKSA